MRAGSTAPPEEQASQTIVGEEVADGIFIFQRNEISFEETAPQGAQSNPHRGKLQVEAQTDELGPASEHGAVASGDEMSVDSAIELQMEANPYTEKRVTERIALPKEAGIEEVETGEKMPVDSGLGIGTVEANSWGTPGCNMRSEIAGTSDRGKEGVSEEEEAAIKARVGHRLLLRMKSRTTYSDPEESDSKDFPHIFISENNCCPGARGN
jgi:hypothetical protein